MAHAAAHCSEMLAAAETTHVAPAAKPSAAKATHVAAAEPATHMAAAAEAAAAETSAVTPTAAATATAGVEPRSPAGSLQEGRSPLS